MHFFTFRKLAELLVLRPAKAGRPDLSQSGGRQAEGSEKQPSRDADKIGLDQKVFHR